ncbi:MAG TPA: hypothetical protein H9826_11570 [Candidatus Intestinimonas merdavium]|uniref:Uncharacterized protein n=1 Tax=Candidatus Intestinimonas merdavium TaxID=2838622 RepID=A0A9D1Z9R9_9FIRM|nr:hypothetical protein [Candidatus Intestinimonas merdavium]
MKTFAIKFLKKCGLLPAEEQPLELPVPVMKNTLAVHEETMVVTGAIVSELTQTFGDNKNSAESYQMAFISIEVSCDGMSCKLYEHEDFIPCTGYQHQLWLMNIRKSICEPLETFMTNVALCDAGGGRP